MSRKHRANICVEGLETKVALSGIAPTVAIYPQPLVAPMIQLEGSIQGTYATLPGTTLTPTSPSIQLQGGGVVSPLGVVSAQGTITAQGGQVTLTSAQKNMTETAVLSAPKVVTSGTDLIETFSYKTTDGLCAGTFIIDFHSWSATASTPSQLGTFDAKFC